MSTGATRSAARSTSILYGMSPWLLVGVSAILGLAVFTLVLRSSEKERQHITHNFLARGDALIWALEAGTRTAPDGEGQRLLLQPLIEQTSRQPGVVYMAVVDADGRVLAHSEPEAAGGLRPAESMPTFRPEAVPKCLPSGFGREGIFEVYRGFAPLSGNLGAHWGEGDHRRSHSHTAAEVAGRMERKEALHFAFVGFDQKPLDEAIGEDFRTNLLTAGAVVGLGLAGFVSLFWAHSYKRSRKKLKDTQAVASEVVSSLPLGLVSSDPEGRLAMVNPAARAMLHLERAVPYETQVRDIPGLDWDDITRALAAGSGVLNKEMEFCPPGAACGQLNVSASEIRDEDGLFLGNLFILQDITAMKRLQREARRNERLTALGNLAAGVAHEIRNPLSSIKGLATYLAGRMHPGGPEERAAGTMAQEVERLNRVVSELLDFARPSVMELSPVEVNEVIGRALRLAGADFAEKNLHVDFTPGVAATVYGNAERLTQALLNLFLNAAQAMDEGGVLTLRVEERLGDECAILVTDNGTGMDAATLASIFTPYFTTRPSGTGLGLAITHRIVEGHGGAITVSSTPGGGSTFTLQLPLQGDA